MARRATSHPTHSSSILHRRRGNKPTVARATIYDHSTSTRSFFQLIERTMFFHIVLERNMQLHPRHFGRDLRDKLVSKLMKDVEGTCRLLTSLQLTFFLSLIMVRLTCKPNFFSPLLFFCGFQWETWVYCGDYRHRKRG